MSGVETQDIHMSRLVGWLVNTLGRALLLSLAVAFGFGVVAVITGDGAWAALGGFAGAIAFGVALYLASAPLPED